LGEWAIRYLDYSVNKHAEKTYREEKVPAFKRLFANPKLSKTDSIEVLTPAIALLHIQNLANRKTGSTANCDRKNLRAAWEWGIKYLELPRLNPFAVVEKQQQNTKPRYVPPEDDFWKAYEAAGHEQDKRLLLCYLHTAARKDELFRLRWTDVDFINDRIRLWARKNRSGEWRGKWIPMTAALVEAMNAQRKVNGKHRFVFIDPVSGLPYKKRYRFMSQLCKKAGVRYFDHHAIRHLTASVLAGLGVPTVDIQQILRHELISTTDRYIKSMKDEKEGRKALALLSFPGKKHSKNHSQGFECSSENAAK